MEDVKKIIEVTRILNGKSFKVYVDVSNIIGISDLMNGGDYFDVFFDNDVWKISSEDYHVLLDTWMDYNNEYKIK